MKLGIIAAVSANGVIGKNGKPINRMLVKLICQRIKAK